MEEKIGTYSLTVEPFQTDFTGRLTLGVLGNQLLNCAGQHANLRGFGLTQLATEGQTWVLSRLAIEMEAMPCQYARYQVQTWIESVTRMFTLRCFAVLDDEGHPLGYARSIWVMIDRRTRRPTDLTTLGSGSLAAYACQHPCPIDRPAHLGTVGGEAVGSVTVRYSDIDINGHVNSIRYLDHVLDLFPLDRYAHSRISRLEATYLAESHFGDCLSLHAEPLPSLVGGGDCYRIEVRHAAGEPVCRCRLTFAPL